MLPWGNNDEKGNSRMEKCWKHSTAEKVFDCTSEIQMSSPVAKRPFFFSPFFFFLGMWHLPCSDTTPHHTSSLLCKWSQVRMWDAHTGLGAASHPCGAKNSSLRSHLVALCHLRPAFFCRGGGTTNNNSTYLNRRAWPTASARNIQTAAAGVGVVLLRKAKGERVIQRRAVFSRLSCHFCYDYGRRLSEISPYARSILRTAGRPVWPAWGGRLLSN